MLFEEQDKIRTKSFGEIDSTLTSPGYTFQKYNDHVVFYRLETNVLNVPEVTDRVRVDRDIHVKLFKKMSGSQNFVVHLQIRLKIGVMR